jgi:hypothetical protein
MIYATMGGVYSNTSNRTLDVVVDNSLCNSLMFADASGNPVNSVLAMPSNYYTLASSQIVIPSGSIMGGVKVQFTDAFFADSLATSTNYVIPLRITKVANADSILSGKPLVANPNPFISTDWSTLPKNYTLYAITYKNPWDAVYLRRGSEIGSDTSLIYHQKYVEDDQVISTAVTKSMTQLLLSLNGKAKGNLNLPFQLLLTFDKSGNCTIKNSSSTSYSITGTGQYVKNGDSWGNIPRDVLHLKYNVNFGTVTHTMTDTLVMRDRAEGFETFTPYFKQ